MTHEQSRQTKEAGSALRISTTRTNGPAIKAALMNRLLQAGHGEVAGEVGRCSTRPLRGAAVAVHLRQDGHRHTTGLNHCKRMLCPICGPYLINKRIGAIKEVVEHLQAEDGLLHFLLTFSVRHDATTPWHKSANALTEMRRSTRRLRSWRKGVVGSFRVLESTYSSNGHHVHEHTLITVQPPQGWEPGRFFEQVEEACQRAAWLTGMTCAFQPGWWVPIPAHDLLHAVTYFASAEKWGQVDHHGDAGHAATWEMPADAFTEVWRESKGVRWFDASGCWKIKHQAEKLGSGAPGATAEAEIVVFHIPASVWTAWSPAERRERLALIYNARVPLPALMEMALGWGARMGPPDVPTAPS